MHGRLFQKCFIFYFIVFLFFSHPICIVPFWGNNHSVCTHNDNRTLAIWLGG